MIDVLTLALDPNPYPALDAVPLHLHVSAEQCVLVLQEVEQTIGAGEIIVVDAAPSFAESLDVFDTTLRVNVETTST